MGNGLQHINWSVRKAPRIAWFLASQAVLRKLDQKFARQPRELALADAVEREATRGDVDAVLRTMDAFSQQRRWLMSMGPEKGALVTAAMHDASIRNVLEIGTYCGYSALLLARHLAPRGGHLVTLEVSRRNSAVARRVIAQAGLAAVVEVRNDVLANAIASFDAPFDLVLLDHWKDEYLADLRRLESARLLRPGTVVIADNVGFFRVPDYLHYVRHGGHYDSRYVPGSVEYHPRLPDGVEISTFKGWSVPP
jgi:catechol O-methyltransferase